MPLPMSGPPSGADTIGAGPPAAPKGPTFAGMAPQGAGPQQQQTGMSPGMSQISSAAVRMAMEIDQALKVLAQQIPALLPWVERTTVELRTQLGQALNSGMAPTSAMSQGMDAQQFPDGGGQL